MKEKRKPKGNKPKTDNLPAEISVEADDNDIETTTTPEDPVTMILNEIKKLGEQQEKFEKQTVDMVDKQTERLNSFAKDIQQQPMQDFSVPSMPPVAPQSPQSVTKGSDGNYIDDKGVSWGQTIPPHLQGKRDEFANPNAAPNSNDLKAYIPHAFALLQAYIQRPQQGAMGQIFTEFIMRDFFENYQQTKLQQKANLNMLVKKGLLSESDVAVTSKNSDILNDPLNKMIDNMKNPQQQQ